MSLSWRSRDRRDGAPDAGVPGPALARRWEWIDRPGLESLEIVAHDEVIVADGAVLVVLDSIPTQVRYRLTYDRSWRFLGASIRSWAGSPGGSEPAVERGLEIVRDPMADAAAWSVDGEPRPDPPTAPTST